MSHREIRVGVVTLVHKEGKVLLGKRINCYGEGQWAPPGGHLEKGESLEACATRELFEEAGLKVLSFHKYNWVRDYLEDQHYIIHLLFVDMWEGEVKLMEPEKCEGWHWFDWDKLPSPLFHLFDDFIKAGGNAQGGFKTLHTYAKERP